MEDPGSFAKGAIQSKANPKLCVEVSKEDVRYRAIEVKECSVNLVSPHVGQFFTLSWHKNLQHSNFDVCVVNSLHINNCHYLGGNQLWKFDIETSQLINPLINNTKCLTLNADKNQLFMVKCNSTEINQKWNFGEKNLTALRSWDNFGVDMTTLKVT